MNKFIVEEIKKEKTKIKFKYKILGEWKKYFNLNKEFIINYDFNIESIPDSICVIPLITDVLPIIWIFNAELEVQELDKNFYESIPEFKKGFIKMYPKVNFEGNIIVKNIIDNSYTVSQKVGSFFSGGVDAHATCLAHIKEKPLLINIQGSDIDIKNKVIVKKLQKTFEESAKNLGLEITFINSTFKNIIKQKVINKYIEPIAKDSYWHGFQHGLGIIGHAACVAYEYKLKLIYIASSFTKEDNMTCASDPSIDNFVKLSSTSIYHDGYEFSRIEKINNIIKFVKENPKTKIKLRVCFDKYNPYNCCHCEKCYRSLYEIILNNYDPKKLGFNYKEDIFKRIKWDFDNKLFLNHTKNWERIQNEFKAEKDKYINDERFNWIFDYKFTTKKTIKKYIFKIYFAIIKRLRRLLKLKEYGEE